MAVEEKNINDGVHEILVSGFICKLKHELSHLGYANSTIEILCGTKPAKKNQ